MNLQEVKEKAVFHHSAATRGYMTRKIEYEIKPYSGRFGSGYEVHRPRWDTTRFHTVEYYIVKGEAK